MLLISLHDEGQLERRRTEEEREHREPSGGWRASMAKLRCRALRFRFGGAWRNRQGGSNPLSPNIDLGGWVNSSASNIFLDIGFLREFWPVSGTVLV